MHSSETPQPTPNYLLQEEYHQAVNFYEQEIALDPECLANYWYLGLSLLLQGQSEEAEMIWAMALAETESDPKEQARAGDKDLIEVWRIILEVCPSNEYAIEFLIASIDLIQDRLVLADLLIAKTSELIGILPTVSSLQYLELCHQLQPENLTILFNLADLYRLSGKYLESATSAAKILKSPHNLVDRVIANFLITSALIKAGGQWQHANAAYQDYCDSFQDLIRSTPPISISDYLIGLTSTVVCSCYFADNPAQQHNFRNQVNQFCQVGIRAQFSHVTDTFQFDRRSNRQPHAPIKIGYLSSCLRRHSVGWLARSVFQYHDRQKFQVYAYSLSHSDDRIQHEIATHSDIFRDLSEIKQIDSIACQIYDDQIDILIDLDSVTSALGCGVIALRPAPVQITWLGSDASGIPNIDCFIADPYVLPDSASSYYAAKIWRLPQTYIAVDGFEVGTPTLRRSDLGIPKGAVVYLSCQAAFKCHPDTVRLQMQIIKSVPNSYFLIKGDGDRDSMQHFFEQIAIEQGVETNRLRFLPEVATEEIHRANLSIADIVLDTYPYNGATTTLETLWVGIPIVTKVGDQFAARNSYTMLINAGVSEGIAWDDRTYIEWGIRFGTEPDLRQQVADKLNQSRHTSPLWQAAQFTQSIELAYEQMWMKFIEQQSTT